MAGDKVLFAIDGKTCFIKLIGEAKYSTTTGFDAFINGLFEQHDVDNVLVDLTDTTYIDSTNLGELTKISTFLMQRHQRRPTLFTTRANISATITGLGLDRVFVLVGEVADDDGLTLQEVPEVKLTERENAMRILDAHRYLTSVNDRTGQIFRSVVDAFERELGDTRVEPRIEGM
jgi:anti-anti-sigma factor